MSEHDRFGYCQRCGGYTESLDRATVWCEQCLTEYYSYDHSAYAQNGSES